MKNILLILVVAVILIGCARTLITATLTDGTVISFFDNKTRTGTEVTVKMDNDGVPIFKYKSETSDANSVALKTLRVADKLADVVEKALLP